MKLTLVTVGQRPPNWVAEGFEFYRRRLPPHLSLELREVPGGHSGKNSTEQQIRAHEANVLGKQIPKGSFTVALDGQGRAWSTEKLAEKLADWQMKGSGIALIVGGAVGLDRKLLNAVGQRWSLGPLTLPHALVRVVVAEQLYRAWTLLSGHPYHRA